MQVEDAVVLLVDGYAFDACGVSSGHEDDFAQRGVVVLVEDDALYLFLRLFADVPCVVLGIDRQGRVVVEVVELAVVAIILEDIATRIIVTS